MEATRNSTANEMKLDQANSHWTAMIKESLRKGFHGKLTLELHITDGTIQRIGRIVERIEK